MSCFAYIVLLEVQSRIDQMVSLYNMETFDLLKIVSFMEILIWLLELPKCLPTPTPMVLEDKTQKQIQGRIGKKQSLLCADRTKVTTFFLFNVLWLVTTH